MFKHQEECTPVSPCNTCKAVAFLREKLGAESFAQFLGIWEGTSATDTAGKDDPFAASPDTLELSVRAANWCKANNITTIRRLLEFREEEILKTPNTGRKMINELKEELGRRGWKTGQFAQ